MLTIFDKGMKFSCGCLAACTSCIVGEQETPLFEVAILRLEAAIRQEGEALVCALESGILMNVFNNIKFGWEPVVDRWPLRLQLNIVRKE